VRARFETTFIETDMVVIVGYPTVSFNVVLLEIFLPKIPAIIILGFWDYFAKFSGIFLF
jgi:hypothetical protein